MINIVPSDNYIALTCQRCPHISCCCDSLWHIMELLDNCGLFGFLQAYDMRYNSVSGWDFPRHIHFLHKCNKILLVTNHEWLRMVDDPGEELLVNYRLLVC